MNWPDNNSIVSEKDLELPNIDDMNLLIFPNKL